MPQQYAAVSGGVCSAVRCGTAGVRAHLASHHAFLPLGAWLLAERANLGYHRLPMDCGDHRCQAAARDKSWPIAFLAGVPALGSSGCGSGPEVSEQRVGSGPSAEHQPDGVPSRESERAMAEGG